MNPSEAKSSLPFDVLFLVVSLLSVRDRVRVSRTSKTFRDAVQHTWNQERELPGLTTIPDTSMVKLIGKFCNLQIFDCAILTPGTMYILNGYDMAVQCRRITTFKSVQMKDLSFITDYIRGLGINPRLVPITCLELLLDDWQVESPHLYEHMSYILSACGQLRIVRLENASYGHLHPHHIWPLIGSRVTALELHCPYISCISVFRPGPLLKKVVSAFTQSDLDLLCKSCPSLEDLQETTFFREPLPDYEAVTAIQSDPTSDSDLILDLRHLKSLKKIKSLTLTSLISPESQKHLIDFLIVSGMNLVNLDLNMSSAPLDLLSSIFSCCCNLQSLTLFFACKSGGPGIEDLTASVRQYSASGKANIVLTFRHDCRTISQ